MSECTNQKGFSMIEVLVALTILIVGTLAVSVMLMRSSENATFSIQSRGSDTTALELVEALKGEAATSTFAEFSALRMQKLSPGSSTQYEYQDDTSATTGTVGTGNFVERQGVGPGQSFVYKWRVEDHAIDYQLPAGMLKLEVTVGWKKCTGHDPTTCTRSSKMTNWIIESSK